MAQHADVKILKVCVGVDSGMRQTTSIEEVQVCLLLVIAVVHLHSRKSFD